MRRITNPSSGDYVPEEMELVATREDDLPYKDDEYQDEPEEDGFSMDSNPVNSNTRAANADLSVRARRTGNHSNSHSNTTLIDGCLWVAMIIGALGFGLAMIHTFAPDFTLSLGKQQPVRVDIISEGSGPAVKKGNLYSSIVTLYVEHADNQTKPHSGYVWSTRNEDGGKSESFDFQPGVNLIRGWTEGVLQMTEGERAWIHVPAAKGYGKRVMGKPGDAFYIPAHSNLLFDIEILGKAQ